MEHIVSGCFNCPMLNNDREYGDRCHHPDLLDIVQSGRFNTYLGKPIPDDCYIDLNDFNKDSIWGISTPEWCPLNSEPITITKEQK